MKKCIVCSQNFSGHHNQKICSDTCKKERTRSKDKEYYFNNQENRLGKIKKYQSNELYKERKRKYDKDRRKKLGDELKEYDKKRRDTDFFGGNREHALKRDNYRCLVCGTDRAIIVHHKDCSGAGKSMLQKKDTNNKLGNLETLCRSCHMKKHLEHIDKTNPISQNRHEY